MDEDIRFILSQIIMERMYLKSKLNYYSFNLRTKGKNKFNKEIDNALDRLKYLEKLEEIIRKRM
jgi:hypothetical protein